VIPERAPGEFTLIAKLDVLDQLERLEQRPKNFFSERERQYRSGEPLWLFAALQTTGSRPVRCSSFVDERILEGDLQRL
jgi:hypothetical protein